LKAVILAGGKGTRLLPLTRATGKQLLPVFDKPVIYYPLSTLIHAGATEILIISSPKDIGMIKDLLGNGKKLGISLSYLIQEIPLGLADGVKISKNFLEKNPFWFILGDNLFHGPDFGFVLKNRYAESDGTKVFAYRVADPSAYGVVKFGSNGESISKIIEKPKEFISKWAITGLYKFDSEAPNLAADLRPSARGEFEIVDLLNLYLNQKKLEVVKISRGNAWFDLGTPENLLMAAQFVHSIQTRQGQLVGSPEEASYNSRKISRTQLELTIGELGKNEYSDQLLSLLEV